MNYLIYVSQAKKPVAEAALAELLNYSRQRNEEAGITGLLIYRYVPEADRGNFMQILEGDPASLSAVWDRISQDSRHHSIVVLEEAETAGRMFATWTMGFQNVSAEDLADYEGYSDLGSDAFWSRIKKQTTAGALGLLQSFYDPS